jgi:hypothetical protein
MTHPGPSGRCRFGFSEGQSYERKSIREFSHDLVSGDSVGHDAAAQVGARLLSRRD